MGITPAKKEKEKKRAKAKQEKAEKMRERRENAKKGKSLEEMMMYVDENGNLSPTPPDPKNKQEIKAEDIDLTGFHPKKEASMKKGILTTFMEDKGYGFITDLNTKESYFVHQNNFTEDIKKGDTVTFELEKTPKGINASFVRKI